MKSNDSLQVNTLGNVTLTSKLNAKKTMVNQLGY
jgi:hypothetical protein